MTQSTPHKQYLARALVVDDCRTDSFLLKAHLESFGCYVDTASGGEEGLKKIQNTPYRIVFLDINMPGITGLEIAKDLKKSSTKPCPPIILVSGELFDKSMEELCMDLGIDGYINKPANEGELCKALQACLSKYEIMLLESERPGGQPRGFLKKRPVTS